MDSLPVLGGATEPAAAALESTSASAELGPAAEGGLRATLCPRRPARAALSSQCAPRRQSISRNVEASVNIAQSA